MPGVSSRSASGRGACRSPPNRVTRDVAVMALIYAALFVFAGWQGALFFAAQSAAGIIVLELFNYIAITG